MNIKSVSLAVMLAAAAAQGVQATPTPKEMLGEFLFFDTNLSIRTGQSCASCHMPEVAFSDPDKSTPVSDGILPHRVGSRNSPVASYMAFSPEFHFDKSEGLYVGGQFWDGRASNLAEQAKQPFLNPLEMANPNKRTVVNELRKAYYGYLFEVVYGEGALDDVARAYEHMADAIAAFERTEQFNPFTSKYDYYLKGEAELTAQELRGLELFEREDKGNCAACHISRPAQDGVPPLFTDFTYDNLGVPRNPHNPFYELPANFNPDGYDFVDVGLAANPQVIGDGRAEQERGKMKVPTLRNIALTEPYMHNGYFQDLRAVVDFYNTRDVKPQCENRFTSEAQALAADCWPVAEVKDNVNSDELGDLGLNEQEVDAIVAFMRTLTDGYEGE